MTPLEMKLLGALMLVVHEIDSMRTSAPSNSDPKDTKTWFGAFSEWRDDFETDAANFSWPNLDIVVESVRPVIKEGEQAADADKAVRDRSNQRG